MISKAEIITWLFVIGFFAMAMGAMLAITFSREPIQEPAEIVEPIEQDYTALNNMIYNARLDVMTSCSQYGFHFVGDDETKTGILMECSFAQYSFITSDIYDNIVAENRKIYDAAKKRQ